MRIKIKFLPWCLDKWNSRSGAILVFDKLEHFVRDFIICLVFGLWASIYFTVFYEYIDGTRPSDVDTDIEGFSFKDVIAGFLGIGLAYIIKLKLC